MDFSKTLRETVDFYGLMAKRALGQNFLLDQNITDKIIRLSLEKQALTDFSNAHVVEIGPGPGGLTRAILNKNPKSLSVIEMDERCIEIMHELQTQTAIKMNIFRQDALTFDYNALTKQKLQIVSNLPYNISVPLLTGWLKKMSSIDAMTLMFQKEVADRILATVKTKEYGRLSVIAQLTCHIQKLLTLSPDCFVPAPKIYSCVLLFKPKQNIPSTDLIEKVEKLTSLAFSGRRKMIRQSLKSISHLEEICQAVDIPLTCRAEELTPLQYLEMAKMMTY